MTSCLGAIPYFNVSVQRQRVNGVFGIHHGEVNLILKVNPSQKYLLEVICSSRLSEEHEPGFLLSYHRVNCQSLKQQANRTIASLRKYKMTPPPPSICNQLETYGEPQPYDLRLMIMDKILFSNVVCWYEIDQLLAEQKQLKCT